MSYKNIISILLLMGLSFLSFAKNEKQSFSLKGRVVDETTQKPLLNATIYLPDLQKGAISDEQGNYVINQIPRGKFLVQVRFAGYKTITAYLSFQDQDLVRDWALSPQIVEGQEVVITGVSRATQNDQQPFHISTLSQTALQQKATDNIIGKIADMPGVSAITTGPDVMKPVIRGLSYNRVVVVNNGIRQEGQQWGDEHGIEIDAGAAGSIDVLRGASSLMYGSDALGGVVNIHPLPTIPEGHIKGELEGNYQTNNGLEAFHGGIRGNQNGFTWHANGTVKQAHDYKNKYDGYVFNTKFRERNYDVGIGLNKSWGYSRLDFSSYDLKLGLTEGERDEQTGDFLKEIAKDGEVEDQIATRKDFMSYHPQIERQSVLHKKLTWLNKLLLGNGDLNLTLGLQQNNRKEYGDVLLPETPGTALKLNTFNYNAHYSEEINGWSLTGGVSGMAQKNLNEGEEYLIPDYSLFDVGVYAIANKEVNRFTFSGGLRGDLRNIRSQALKIDNEKIFDLYHRNFSDWSGSFGTSFRLSRQLLLKANISKGFRTPSIFELSANGVHEGTARYEHGNTGLKPEKSLEFDAGAAYESEHISASLYGYANQINNFIFSRRLLSATGSDSLTTTSEGTFQTFQYEQTKALLYGLEASIDIHPHPLDWLHFKNTFSFVRGERLHAIDSLKNLPMIPAARWIPELGIQFPRNTKTFRNIYFHFKVENTFAQHHYMTAYHTETYTPSYSLLGVDLGTDIANRKGKTLFKVLLSGENLTDKAYQDHLSRMKYFEENPVTGRPGIFNMGRNFSFKVIVPFSVM